MLTSNLLAVAVVIFCAACPLAIGYICARLIRSRWFSRPVTIALLVIAAVFGLWFCLMTTAALHDLIGDALNTIPGGSSTPADPRYQFWAAATLGACLAALSVAVCVTRVRSHPTARDTPDNPALAR